MQLFSYGRIESFPSQYPTEKFPVIIDRTEIIIILLFVITAVSYLIIIPGYKKKQSVYVFTKVIASLAIGCALLLENFGQEWEVGYVRTKTPYRAGVKHEIEAVIGMKIGLRSVNVTLQGKGEEETPLAKEIINYNERFPWTWDQGVFGFGPNAGLLQRTFRDAQRRGVPIPILWVVEYFIMDGEGIRFGRFYRTAGWYCHLILWAAFAGWILANIFLQSVGRLAAYSIAISGSLQLLCCVIWILMHNPTPLVIPFEGGSIRARLGLHYWMTFSCGTLCTVIAAIIIYMDLRHPNALARFLGLDPLNEYDECVMKYSELENIMRNEGKMDNAVEMSALDRSNSTDENVMVLKRRSTMKNAQKSRYLSPIPVRIQSNNDETDEVIYENEFMSRLQMPNVQEHRKKEEDRKPPIPKKIMGRKVFP